MKKFGLSLIVFSVIFGILITVLGLKLKDGLKFNNLYPETRWADFYSQKPNSIDLLFIGSSHCYRSFIPSIIDSIKKTNSFNLGSSAQSPITSFFVLEEALRNQNPKKVILEIYTGSISKGDNFSNALINFDYIKSTDVKFSLINTADNLTDILEAFIPAYRYNNYKTTLFRKSKPKNVEKLSNGLSGKYFNKGYVQTIANSNFIFDKEFNETKILYSDFSINNLEYISKIANLCKDNNIEFSLITQSLNPLYFKKIEGYDVFHNTIDSISKVNNIKYIDGNYYIEEIGLTNKDYYDSGHMLYSGAVKFSAWYANKLKEYDEIKE